MATGWEPIEGETPIDPSGLIDKSIRTRSQLIPIEAENIRKVHQKYLTRRPTQAMAPFDCAWMLKLHEEMYCDVWDWAGQFRTTDANLGVDKSQIGSRMAQFINDLESLPYFEMSEQVAKLHHEAVCIHPFVNGNGRWARMLANIWQLQKDTTITAWPEESIGQKSLIRGEYLKAVRAGDNNDLSLLIMLHKKYTTSL